MTDSSAGLRVLACPHCGGSVSVRAAGISVSAVCGSCGSTIDVATPELRVIADAQARTRTPTIAIGTRATLVGTEWEVIGFQERRAPAEGWSWEEYLLFNPYEGFRFLVHDETDWTLYAMLHQDVPETPAGPRPGDGRSYVEVSRGAGRTEYVMGEFYWRVRVGDEVSLVEYAAPPYLLSREANAEEVTWSRGVQLPATTVHAAFGLSHAAAPPTPTDAALQRRAVNAQVWQVLAAAVALLLLLSALPIGRSRNAVLFRQTLTATADNKSRPLTTDPFTVPDARGNLQIETQASLRNAWIELGFSLVDQASNRSFNGHASLSHYSGYDSDGSYDEAAEHLTVSFARVPGGTYRLLIDVDAKAFSPESPPSSQASADAMLRGMFPTLPVGRTAAAPPFQPAPVSFEVLVRRHVPSTAILLVCLLALLPYPVWRLVAGLGQPPMPDREAIVPGGPAA